MARSVSVPRNAELVCYREIDMESDFAWEDLVEDVVESCKANWPSLDGCDKWLDREDHALLENDLVYIGVSGYMGLASVWVVPKTNSWGEPNPLAFGWIRNIRKDFNDAFGELTKLGSFSNGEAVFQRRATNGHITSKGYDTERNAEIW